MKKKVLLPLVLIVALTGGLAAGRAMAQPPSGNAPGPMHAAMVHHYEGHGRHHENRLKLMADILQLTPAQRSQIRKIVKSEMKAMKPWFRQARKSRRELHRATANGAFNPKQVRRLAERADQARTELLVSRARVKSRIYALLSPEQRLLAQKLRQLMARRSWDRHPGRRAF